MKGEREIVQWTVSIWQDEQVLEMDSHSNGHTGTVHLKMVKMVYFMLHVFTKHKKTPRAVCVVGEGEGAPRPGGAQQKGRQRGADARGPCPSGWACPPWESAAPRRRPRPAWSACSRGARQTPGRATASSAPCRGKAAGQVRVRRRLSAINLPSPPGQPLREGADL